MAHVVAREARAARGKLKVFLGYAPGVGKTYAMLQEALSRSKEGREVVVGVVETHGRAETEALLAGLELLPRRQLEYKDVKFAEFDLDAALSRRPALLLVDELAHTNAPGSRHTKRWQDVEELLAAGIDVFTTVNVQHVESLNDVVARITGVTVREAVPNSILDRADEIELVDVSPDELQGRLEEGKVYIPDQAAQAIRSFFRKGNLHALRQLALRLTADRVDAQMQDYRRDKAIRETWPATERLLVCVSPSPYAERLIRATRRMADGLHAQWIALYVETPGALRLPQAERDRAFQALRLAEQLGARTVTINAQDLSDELLRYARTQNVTRIVVGKPKRRRLRDLFYGSVVDELVWKCGDIDVYVISGEADAPSEFHAVHGKPSFQAKGYVWALCTVALCTVLARLLFPYFHPTNLIMLYLMGVMAIAARQGRGPSVLASVLSVVAFDFFFVTPYLSFAVSDTEYIITFIVMFALGFLISDMTARIRLQAEAARNRERESAALYDLSRELTGVRDLNELLDVATRQVSRMVGSRTVVLLPNEIGVLEPRFGDATLLNQGAKELAVAQWVFMRDQNAGYGTQTLPDARATYLPLRIPRGVIGVLGLEPSEMLRLNDPERMHFVEAFCGQVALALERESLALEAQTSNVEAEAERMRSTLLSSVSHDLRTPLTVIAGSAGSLLDEAHPMPESTRTEMIQGIYQEAQRLDRLVRNLLEITRLQSGAVVPDAQWHVLSDLVGTVLNRLDSQLEGRTVKVNIPDDLPLVRVDGLLLEQVVGNLVENAIKYAGPDGEIGINAMMQDEDLLVEVTDQGPGFPAGEAENLFRPFYQAREKRSRRGVGLGLAICQEIVKLHGGRIWAENRPAGGAAFKITLPMSEPTPSIDGAEQPGNDDGKA